MSQEKLSLSAKNRTSRSSDFRSRPRFDANEDAPPRLDMITLLGVPVRVREKVKISPIGEAALSLSLASQYPGCPFFGARLAYSQELCSEIPTFQGALAESADASQLAHVPNSKTALSCFWWPFLQDSLRFIQQVASIDLFFQVGRRRKRHARSCSSLIECSHIAVPIFALDLTTGAQLHGEEIEVTSGSHPEERLEARSARTQTISAE